MTSPQRPRDDSRHRGPSTLLRLMVVVTSLLGLVLLVDLAVSQRYLDVTLLVLLVALLVTSYRLDRYARKALLARRRPPDQRDQSP